MGRKEATFPSRACTTATAFLPEGIKPTEFSWEEVAELDQAQ